MLFLSILGLGFAWQQQRHIIPSTTLSKETAYTVWLPDDYNAQKQYPLLLMLHGLGDSDQNWSRGSVPRILQEAISLELLPEHIVLVPDGARGYWVDNPSGSRNYESWVFEALRDVESKFSLYQEPAQRSIMGVSMGAWGALSIGLRHPEDFGQIIALSPTDIFIALQTGATNPLYTQAFGSPPNLHYVAARSPRELILRGAGTQQRIAIVIGTAEADKFAKGVERLTSICTIQKISFDVLKVHNGTHSWRSTWTESSFLWWMTWLGEYVHPN